MNLVMRTDFRGMGTLIGRMRLEAHLRTKYLQRIKMFLYH